MIQHQSITHENYMKKTFSLLAPILALGLQLTTTSLYAKGDAFMLGHESPAGIFVNNRILARVNGKSVSVIDLMKKMDVLFYKQFPQYTSSVEARFQFYEYSWKHVLQEFIDKELILADAEEKKVPVSSGDVRQEMETLFGPNIIMNLDKIGLTFEEAWKMVQNDIKIRRMIYARANLKAIKQITPQDVRSAYDEYAKENIQPEKWVYSVISIRNSDLQHAAEAATFAYQYLSQENEPIEKLQSAIANGTFGETTKLTISETFNHDEKELSPAYKEVLTTLSSASYSKPIPQKSRSDNSTVFRIFYLKEKIPGGVVSFNEVEAKLKETLMDEAINNATVEYLKKLRHHYHIKENCLTEMTSEDFKPFSLK